MVEYAAVVAQCGQSQLERLHLQFISGDVVFQCHPLRLASLDVVDEPAGEGDVLLVDLHAVVCLVEVEILSESHKAHLLAGQHNAVLGLSLSHFGQTDAGIDGTSGVDHLLGLQRETVAEVRRA